MSEAYEFEHEDHVDLFDAIVLTSRMLGVSMDVARLMIRDAVAKGELIGFVEKGGRVERMSPNDIEVIQ